MAKTNTKSRTSTRGTVSRNLDSARKWAGTATGRSVLAGIAATAAGLLLSRDRRVRDAATDAAEKVRDAANSAAASVREAATETADKVRAKVAEHRAREVGDDLADPFDVPVVGRTRDSAGVIAH